MKTCKTCYNNKYCRHCFKSDGSWNTPCDIYLNLKEYNEERHILKTCETCIYQPGTCMSCVKSGGSWNTPCDSYFNIKEANEIISKYTPEQAEKRKRLAEEYEADIRKKYFRDGAWRF